MTQKGRRRKESQLQERWRNIQEGDGWKAGGQVEGRHRRKDLRNLACECETNNMHYHPRVCSNHTQPPLLHNLRYAAPS